jgi:hypothetical protein
MTVEETPNKLSSKLAGAALDRLGAREIQPGEKLVLIVEGRLAKHNDRYDPETGEFDERVQVLDAADVYELGGTEGRDVLRQVRNRWQLADDGTRGVMPFDHSVPAAQYVSSDGTVLTPAEIAEARGESWSPADDLTVEFAGGVRAFWPDDWGGGSHSLPGVGGFMQVPGGDPGEVVQVVRLLDPESGDLVAEWTDVDEEARELAEAAREDREAHEQLQAARAEDAAELEDEGE